MKTTIIFSAALAVFSMTSCEKSETTTSASAPEATAPDPALEQYFTAEPIADAGSIHVLRESVAPGDEITLRGEVIGREKVFVEGRAAFVLGDPEKLTSCDKMPEDHCPTPWDACCDSPELKKTGIASIQILGEDGRVLPGNIRGVKGLKELSEVTLTGTVDKSSTKDNLIVNATMIHVVE